MKSNLLILVLSVAFVSCLPSNEITTTPSKISEESTISTLAQTSTYASSIANTNLYRAINLNGSASTYFESSGNAQNVTITGKTIERYDVPLTPLTDESLGKVIRSSIWGFSGEVNIKINQVPTGDYDVYLYVWEDNNSEVFSILMNGNVVQPNYVSGSAGAWKKLGPFRKKVSDGLIHLSSSGGAANFSAVEIHKVPQTISNPDPAAANLILNAGFESALNNWTNLGNALRVTSPVNSGTGSARVGPAAGGLLQYINLKPNSEYELSGSARVGASGEVGNYGVTFKDSNEKEITNFQFKVSETTFTKKKISFKTPTSFAKAEVWMYKGSGSSYLYLDDVSLVEKVSIPPVVAACEGMGSITHEHWSSISGSGIAAIPLTKTPTTVKTINSLEIKNLGDSYGTRISGYVCPPVSGNYTFYISGDDDTKLSLSSNDSATGLIQIAGFSGWTNQNELAKYPGQKSKTIALVAGKKYFVEVLHKEAGGSDHVSVGWDMPDGKREFPLPSSRIAPKVVASSQPSPAPSPVVCNSEGKISLERFNNFHSIDPHELNGKVANSITTRQLFEAPSNIGDNYGHRMSGLICVPTSGSYTFYIAGDDQVALFLSSDDRPENKKEIASHNSWTNAREYNKYPSQTSIPVNLVAGKKYYIEALQVEQGGEDNLSVGWKLPNGVLERPIPGTHLSTNPGLKESIQEPAPVAGNAPGREDAFNPGTISYSGPIVISKGGTYTGNWQSTNSGTPAVWIKTAEPVIIENSVIRGAGMLIQAASVNANLVVRNTRGYGLPYTDDYFNDGRGNTYRPARRFLNAESFKNILVENNYLEQTAGIYLSGTHRVSAASDAVRIRYNKVKNIDGRIYGGRTLVQFVQFNMSGGTVQNAEIAYNQVINEAGKSLVEDNINIFNTRGTAANPIRIHNNYIEGAFPMPTSNGGLLGIPYSGNYSGGGIIADSPGDRNDPSKITAYMEVYDNQMISSMNYSFGVATGSNMKFYRNRAVISDYLIDGRKVLDVFPHWAPNDYKIFPNGYWSNDYYNSGNTHSISFDSNLCGVSRFGERIDSFSKHEGTTITNHKIMPPGPITLDILKNEYVIFSDKVKANGFTIGPR